MIQCYPAHFPVSALHRPPRDLQFREYNFRDLEVNHEIHENIVPQKFGAIRYILDSLCGNTVTLAVYYSILQPLLSIPYRLIHVDDHPSGTVETMVDFRKTAMVSMLWYIPHFRHYTSTQFAQCSCSSLTRGLSVDTFLSSLSANSGPYLLCVQLWKEPSGGKCLVLMMGNGGDLGTRLLQ